MNKELFKKKLVANNYRMYELWAIGEARETIAFEECKKDYVAATVGGNFSQDYVYYKRYKGDKFYKLHYNELAFMKLKGEEIPF